MVILTHLVIKNFKYKIKYLKITLMEILFLIVGAIYLSKFLFYLLKNIIKYIYIYI